MNANQSDKNNQKARSTHAPVSLTIDVVILAAGASSRLGQPKQHIVIGSDSLLDRAIRLASDFGDAVASQRKPLLISGAFLQRDCTALAAGNHQRTIAHHYNVQWRDGMASSLQCARPLATADGVLVLLVDQYRVGPEDLMALYTRWSDHPDRVVAAGYADTVGPPVIWPRRLWSEPGPPRGSAPRLGKALLLASDPLLIDMPRAETDLDTPEDLEAALGPETD